MNNIIKLPDLKISRRNKIKSTYQSIDDNDIYDILSQDSFLMLNRKLYSVLGLELATFITFLIDKEKYYKNNYKLDNEGYFYITNADLLLHTGIKASRINNLKNESVEKNLLYLKKAGIPLKTYYKVNISKVREIIYNSKSSLDLAYNRLINDENLNLEDLKSFSISTLERKTYRDLRLICKNMKISYSGKDKKSELIDKIMLQTENPVKEMDNLVDEITDTNKPLKIDEKSLKKYTTLSLRTLCKNMKIPYSGKDKKMDLINKILNKNEMDNQVDKYTNTKNENLELEKIKNLILSFDGLDLNWNSYLENIISSFLKKHKLSLTLEYLTSNYKNVMANSLIQNKTGCFISLLKKEQRQINSVNKNKENLVVEQVDKNKENLVVEQVDKNKDIIDDNILFNKFLQLEEYEKLKVEEEIFNGITDKAILDSLLKLKGENQKFYYSTLKNEIQKIMKNKVDISGQ
ncbi:hypothetical protein, partial [Fusobacterium sp. SYSU M8D902]|uniref:hypothetical protein n=1 Tax=Fusobacterium sp. SYSU M8D902 TaxID=3159562 RepID=UPI0032E48375